MRTLIRKGRLHRPRARAHSLQIISAKGHGVWRTSARSNSRLSCRNVTNDHVPRKRTARAALQADGWTCQVVEHWNPFSRTRLDLFGCIDIIAVRASQSSSFRGILEHDGAILGVQCTTMDHLAARIAKAKAEPRLQAWLKAGGLFECYGWRVLKRGLSRPKWIPQITELSHDGVQIHCRVRE